MEQKRLYRSRTDRMFAGVAGGLGDYFNLDPVIFRIIFVLLAFQGFGILLYLVLWVVIPEEPVTGTNGTADAAQPKTKAAPEEEFEERIEKVASEMRESVDRFSEKVKSGKGPEMSNSQVAGGFLLVLIGVFFLLGNIISFDFIGRLWPVILIVLGVLLLTRRPTKHKE